MKCIERREGSQLTEREAKRGERKWQHPERGRRERAENDTNKLERERTIDLYERERTCERKVSDVE